MSVERSGPPFPGPTSGVEHRHGEAGRRVAEAYQALLTSAGAVPEPDEPLSSEAAPSDAQPKPEPSRQQRRFQERQFKKQQRQIERQAKRQVGWKER